MHLRLLDRTAFILFFICFSLCAMAQERFNVTNDIDLNAAVFVGVSEIEYGYGVVGNGVYSPNDENQTPLFFTRFNYQEEFIDRKMHLPESGLT